MKHRKEFLLDESTISYIEQYCDENHLRTMTASITKIVDEHKHRNDIPATKILVEELAKDVAKELSSPLTRIRLGVNNADRNSDIILLLLNTLIGYSPYKTLFEDDTPQLKQARAIIKERIANYRQRRLDASLSKTDKRNKMEAEIKQERNDQQLLIPEDDLLKEFTNG